MKAKAKPRVVVIFNRDFEGADADPENRAREDIKDIAEHIMRILNAHGFDAKGVGVTNDVAAAMNDVRALAPAAVFNLCESVHGDNRFEALLPMLMDLEGLAYTGSGPLSLGLALHKNKAKEILRASNVPTPKAVCVRALARGEELPALGLSFPVIVKPTREDASVGVSSASVVRDHAAMTERVHHVLEHYHQPALVEEFIEGREIYVSLLGRVNAPPQVFPFFEIDFSDLPADRPRIVSFEGKWVEDSAEYKGTRPVRCEGLSPATKARITETVLAGFAAMDLRDYARFDIRLAADGTPYVIDVNPNCDLSDLAGGFSKAAKAGGLSYDDLILRVVELAMGRREHADTIPLASRSTDAAGPHRSAEPAQPVSPRRGAVRARAPRGGA